ncbi:MAG: transglutaminase family protein [Mariniblastus sp.]|nr:transglutaminase family protein [Mariniblastus sp.]
MARPIKIRLIEVFLIAMATFAIIAAPVSPKRLKAQEDAGNNAAVKTNEQDTSKKPSTPPSSPKQDGSDRASSITYSNPVQSKWKVGVRIVGGAASAKNLLITIPVPNDWPEQSVVFDDVEVKSTSRVVDGFRNLDSGIRQLVVKMPRLGAREEVLVAVTCVVTTRQITAPKDPTLFVKPKTSHREGKPYLGVGPDINFRNTKLRNEVKSIVKDKETTWEQVEGILDWIHENIEDTVQEPGDVVSVFRNKKGCNEDKVGLFVAMCRANKIPARIVWVQGTQHAEFMLADSGKNAHWFPARPAGLREMGAISDPRVVLQKGDSIRVPEKDQRQKFVAEFVTCEGKSAASKPRVRFFRELLPDDE